MLPQPPQFWGSVAMFTQADPHVVCWQVGGVTPPDPDFVHADTRNTTPKRTLRATSLTLFMVLVRKCPQHPKPITEKRPRASGLGPQVADPPHPNPLPASRGEGI